MGTQTSFPFSSQLAAFSHSASVGRRPPAHSQYGFIPTDISHTIDYGIGAVYVLSRQGLTSACLHTLGVLVVGYFQSLPDLVFIQESHGVHRRFVDFAIRTAHLKKFPAGMVTQ